MSVSESSAKALNTKSFQQLHNEIFPQRRAMTFKRLNTKHNLTISFLRMRIAVLCSDRRLLLLTASIAHYPDRIACFERLGVVSIFTIGTGRFLPVGDVCKMLAFLSERSFICTGLLLLLLLLYLRKYCRCVFWRERTSVSRQL